MTKKIQLHAQDYMTDSNKRGLLLQLSVYDVPRLLTSDFDEKTGVLKIEFQYLDQEPARTEDLQNHLSLRVGKESGKIIGIDVPVEKFRIEEVLIGISHRLRDRADALPRQNQRSNYEFVSSVLDANKQSLAEAAI